MITGIENLKTSLSAIASAEQIIIAPVLSRFVREVVTGLGNEAYAPERPNQKYIRTGKLGRSYNMQQVSPSEFVVGNAASYSGYVVGKDGDQAWMHAGRWWQARQKAEDRADEFFSDVERQFLRVWDR